MFYDGGNSIEERWGLKMAKKMTLNELDVFFDMDKDFELTPMEYRVNVGKPLPMSKQSIIGKNAPLRRKAAEKGFDIRVETRQVKQLVVIFTKKEKVEHEET